MDFLSHGSFRTIILFLYPLTIFVGVCHSQDYRSVRLVDGESPRTGRVEIYNISGWATVTTDGWTNTEAIVVCRQLGFHGPAVTKTFGPGVLGSHVPVLSVKCPENAKSLDNCDISQTKGTVMTDASLDYLNGQEQWEYDENAGVDCQEPSRPGFPTIVNIVLVVALLCLIACAFLIYYLYKKRAEAKEQVDARGSDIPMTSRRNNDEYARRIEKDYEQPTEEDYAHRIEKDYSQIQENPGQQYAAINPAEVEPENSYESPQPAQQA